MVTFTENVICQIIKMLTSEGWDRVATGSVHWKGAIQQASWYIPNILLLNLGSKYAL